MSATVLSAQAQAKWTPYLQNSGIYFSSDHITVAGVGIGAGLACTINEHLIIQGDISDYWISGNAISTRLSAGYKKSGKWTPCVMGTFSVLWGSRIEILLEDGRRPISPVPVVGIHINPLFFENDKGFVSALEAGFGIGPYNGICPEITILRLGIHL